MNKRAPVAFHVMAKPTGARCNLSCDYCFFKEKSELYPNSSFRMANSIMEKYIRQTIEAQEVPSITVAWQGGEPTLMGLDFFRRTIEVQKRYVRPDVSINNTIQTNGVLLDEGWAEFLRENDFLVGLSMDGPGELHDAYRHDKAGRSVFDKVVGAARLMQKEGVEFNILSTVNSKNAERALDVYRFFRDELGARFLQFIPIVEPRGVVGQPDEKPMVSEHTVRPEAYGKFLTEIFDEWLSRDVGNMFVQTFDGVLASYARGYSSLCIFQPTCGNGVALEHNGDLYSCDHFVDREYLLGNISETPLKELATSEQQRGFGDAKFENLPKFCGECPYEFTCYGECPKNRIITAPDGESGLNWLCSGLRQFFAHTERPMRLMADLLKQGRTASEIMSPPAGESMSTGRNDPCPCGSGHKYKRCCI